MKIAVSSTGIDLKSLMDDRFGRCDYFVIYDSELETTEYIENDGKKSEAGAGIVAAQQILDKNIDVLITGYLGPNAFDVFEGDKIIAFKCRDVQVKKAIDLYKSNKLEKMECATSSKMNI